MATSKKHNDSVDLIKFFATLLVVNSHMSISYAKYKFLATGGGLVILCFSLYQVLPYF